VTGKFVLTGGGAGPQIRVDLSAGILPKNVLYNIIGTGPDVAFSGGGGGENCCAAIVDGTLLAPLRKINLSPGLVNGEVISAMNITSCPARAYAARRASSGCCRRSPLRAFGRR